MELPELHVFQRNARACGHAEAIAGVDEGVGARRENAPRAAGSKQGCLGVKNHHLAGFHFQRGDAEHIAFQVANQIECHPLDKKLRVRKHVALVQRMQHRVTGAVSGTAGTLHRFFTEILGMTTEGALINSAILIAVKRHAEVFEFDDRLRRSFAHELDRILVAQPVGALDGVVHMPVPIVLAHVAQ